MQPVKFKTLSFGTDKPKPRGKKASKKKPGKKKTTAKKNQKDRDKVSTRYDDIYKAKLVKVRAGIKNKDFDVFTATVAKRYGLNNDRRPQAKIDLKKEGQLIQVGSKYYARTADIPTKK